MAFRSEIPFSAQMQARAGAVNNTGAAQGTVDGAATHPKVLARRWQNQGSAPVGYGQGAFTQTAVEDPKGLDIWRNKFKQSRAWDDFAPIPPEPTPGAPAKTEVA
jgi:hypothetical protein